MRLVGALCSDQAGGVPGGAARELTAFQQQHILPTELCQVPGDARTRDSGLNVQPAGGPANRRANWRALAGAWTG